MPRHLLPLFLLAGCVTDTPAPDALFNDEVEGLPEAFLLPIEDVAPPPMALIASALVPGAPVTITAVGANPGDQVWFLRSPSLGTTCAPILGGDCLQISQPVVITSVIAGTNGTATMLVDVPRRAPLGITMHFQAGVLGASGYLSDLISVTSESFCGDGILHADEECDDGNLDDADGCANDCLTGFCGDGLVGAQEACDDGNSVQGDGCNQLCELDRFDVRLISARLPTTQPNGDTWDESFLVSGFEPPDPYIEIYRGSTLLGSTLVQDDTYTPTWNASFVVSVQPGETLRLRIMDEDITFDDTVDDITLSWALLSGEADAGTFSTDGAVVSDLRIRVSSAPL